MRPLEAQLSGHSIPESIHCLDGHLSVRGWREQEVETLAGRERGGRGEREVGRGGKKVGKGRERRRRGKEKKRRNPHIRINSDEVQLTFPSSP